MTPTTGVMTPAPGAGLSTTRVGQPTTATGVETPTTGAETPTARQKTATKGEETPVTQVGIPTTGVEKRTTSVRTPTTGTWVSKPVGCPTGPIPGESNGTIRLRRRRLPVLVVSVLLLLLLPLMPVRGAVASRAGASPSTASTTAPTAAASTTTSTTTSTKTLTSFSITTSTTASTTAAYWSPGDPLFPDLNQTSKSTWAARCGLGVNSDCFLASPEPKDRQSAHVFCRSRGGFLANWDDLRALVAVWPPKEVTWLEGNLTQTLGVLTWPLGNLTQNDLTWTALTTHEGRYQWLSHLPGMGEFLAWEGLHPPLWSRECAAFHLQTQQFHLHSCTDALAFYCRLPPSAPPSEADPRDVELRVASNMDMTDNWIMVREGDFSRLSLTCTAHSRVTGEPLTTQPSLFWSKDGVYIHSYTSKIFPAIVHDSTKSETEEKSPFLLKQGTYWCEAWAGRSPTRLVSNKVLVTLENWLVLIVAAHRYEASEGATPSDAVSDISQAFGTHFPDFDNYSVDLLSVERELSPGTMDSLAKYRFQVHIPDNRDSLSRVLSLFQDGDRVYGDIFETNGYLRTSSLALSTHCLSHTQKYDQGKRLMWPFTAAGRVHPLHYRCEVAGGMLQAGYCRWNHTHGANVSFDSSQCDRFDHCPRDYTGVSDHICASVTTPGAWEKGFQAMYRNGIEKGVLDSSSFHQREEGEELSVYERMKQTLKDTKDYSQVWLPVRRLAPWGPLTFLGPGTSDYPYSHYEGSSLFNISWAPSHPLPDRDCLALDMEKNQLLTLSCDTALPFVALLNVSGLRDLPNPNWSSSVPGLMVESRVCPQDWYSTRYHRNVCFRLFLDVQNSTWGDAKEFCERRDAQLASPAIGFLDWVYRQYLFDSGVAAVWMSEVLPESVGSSAQGGSQEGFINWKANTNNSLPFTTLTVDGWTREGSSATKRNILCQRIPLDVPTTNILVKESEEASSQTICVYVMHEDLLVNDTDSLRCFVSGRSTDLKQGNNTECRYEIYGGVQGHVQCQAWVLTPFHLTKSNVLLNRTPRTLTYAVSLHQGTDYRPNLHDSTFASRGPQKVNPICVNPFTKTLEREFKRLRFPDVTLRVDNFFYSQAATDAKLTHNFHVELQLPNDKVKMITEEGMFQSLVKVLPSGESYRECSLARVGSTVGCLGQVTRDRSLAMPSADDETMERNLTWPRTEQGTEERNLTWPKTTGNAIVLPEELCINVRGEPVTRECLGEFLPGYRWGIASGNCTGAPSNVTRSLWEINKPGLDSPPSVVTTLSDLTANGSSLKPVDIHFVATKFQSLSQEDTLPELDLESIVETLNNVMKADDEAFAPVQKRLNSSSVLFEAFENIAFKVKLPEKEGDQTLMAIRELVSVERVDLETNSTIIGFQSKADVLEEKTLKVGSEVNPLETDVAIIFPENLTRIVASGSEKLSKLQTDTRQKLQLTFAVYRNPKLFQDNESYPNYSVNTHILQATYNNKVVTNLKEPVKLIFRPSRLGNDSKCVYWDFQKNSGKGGWSTEGCWKGEPEGDRQVCFCNHLTCFAQLMNYDDEHFGGTHGVVLNVITIIGCSLSVVSLLLVFTTFFLFKKWRRHLRNKILVNLSFSIFCSIVIFLAGINQTWNDILCRSVAVALHYFILASFGWMLVEAVHQYLKFVKVVGTYIPRFMWKASVSAWGAPVLPIIVVLVYDSSLYDNRNDDDPDARICWMSSEGFKYAFLPPLVLTMTVNLVMFSLIIYGATCGRVRVTSTMSDRELYMSQLRMAICIFFLLGFTWIFGLLAVWKARLTFSYLFCIFNTLQGFFIFLFHVYRERGARRLWRSFLSIKSKRVASEQASSQNINNSMQYKDNNESVTYNQAGGVSMHPKKPFDKDTRSSVRSAITSSTLLQSRTSINP
ncbi:uncharacterized protein [Panulirus ornatus]|uniref:uncharacterized protein n=1 Tax=Panulirus ornatus TaxID=150431 RepID=UPI003A896CF4